MRERRVAMSSPGVMGTHAILLATIVFGTPVASRAEEVFIEMFSSTFLPPSVEIEAGDTVTWVWIAGDHLLTSGIPGGAPGTPEEPGALFQVPIDAQNPRFSHAFPTGPDGIAFHDALNPSVIGFIDVQGDALIFEVAVLDNVFEPEILRIFEGDAVHWVHEPGEMLHTVTSGLSSAPEHDPGALFDATLSDPNPVFAYTFTEAVDQPYFCRPHENLGMTGTVIVEDRFVRGDANRDLAIGIPDALLTLGYLFQSAPEPSCVDALDTDDDGSISLADPLLLLGYLFAGGPAPGLPFPDEGPDRTDDGLVCRP